MLNKWKTNVIVPIETTKDLKERFCNWKEAFDDQHQKNKSDDVRVGRRTVQKQDRSIWSLCEESDGQIQRCA